MIEVKEKEFEVGQILLGVYGYEARYPEFYKIEKIEKGYVTLQSLKKVFKGRSGNYSGDISYYSTEGEASEAKKFRRKIKNSGSCQYVMISSYEVAQIWGGKDEEQYNYH